jgi:hypothetical protein
VESWWDDGVVDSSSPSLRNFSVDKVLKKDSGTGTYDVPYSRSILNSTGTLRRIKEKSTPDIDP